MKKNNMRLLGLLSSVVVLSACGGSTSTDSEDVTDELVVETPITQAANTLMVNGSQYTQKNVGNHSFILFESRYDLVGPIPTLFHYGGDQITSAAHTGGYLAAAGQCVYLHSDTNTESVTYLVEADADMMYSPGCSGAGVVPLESGEIYLEVTPGVPITFSADRNIRFLGTKMVATDALGIRSEYRNSNYNSWLRK